MATVRETVYFAALKLEDGDHVRLGPERQSPDEAVADLERIEAARRMDRPNYDAGHLTVIQGVFFKPRRRAGAALRLDA